MTAHQCTAWTTSQVYRWHDLGQSHQLECWVRIWRGSATNNSLVKSQHPVSNCERNKRDSCWLQEAQSNCSLLNINKSTMEMLHQQESPANLYFSTKTEETPYPTYTLIPPPIMATPRPSMSSWAAATLTNLGIAPSQTSRPCSR